VILQVLVGLQKINKGLIDAYLKPKHSHYLNLKEQQLRTKLETELNSWNVLNQQVRILTENVKSLEALLTGETRRFEIGESSLFLVNAREVAVFDSRVTLNDLSAKLQIAFAKTRFAAGIGFEQN
jgi:outer membrane protein TolC